MKKNRVFWLFLVPSFTAFIVTMLVPFVLGVWYSFTNWSGGYGTVEFVGLENYQAVISDQSFWYSFIITFIFAFLSVISINIVAFILAKLVTRGLKLESFYRAAFFLPNLIGGLILGYIWQFLFNQVFVELLSSNDFVATSLLSNRNSAIMALVGVLTWQYAGYIMMIYVTAILNIPQDVIEAAKIDGAKAMQRLYHIELPMLASAFTVTLFLTLVNSFKQFDVIFSLTAGGPSSEFLGKPIMGTQTIAMHIYQQAYQLKDMATAQAEAVIFFIILALISVVQVILNKRKEIEA